MSEAYDWTWLRTVPVIDIDTYLAMPAELSRTIEVKDGFPVVVSWQEIDADLD